MKLVGAVFRDNLTQLRVMLKRQPTVTISGGQAAAQYASSCRYASPRHHESAIVVSSFAIRQTASLRRAGHLVIAETPPPNRCSSLLPPTRARRVICFAHDQKTGIQVAGLVRELWSARTRTLRGEPRLPCAPRQSVNSSTAVCSQVQADSVVRVHFFNLHKMVARSLFDRFPQELAPTLMNGARRIRGPDRREAQAILVQGLRVFHMGLLDGVARVGRRLQGRRRAAVAGSAPPHGRPYSADIRFHGSDAHYRALVDDSFACPVKTRRGCTLNAG